MNERDIFLAALDIEDDDARASFLLEKCGDDAELLTRVKGLLASHESQSRFLKTPAVEQIADNAAAAAAQTQQMSDGSTEDELNEGETNPAATFISDHNDADDEIPLGFLNPSDRQDSLGRLKHYEILEVIGRGAFGIVLKAFDESLQRVVAIKVLSPEMAATSPARKRFKREAESSAKVRHENVVSIYAVEGDPLPYLVMEYIPGETLQQRLDATGPLEVLEVLRLGKQMADGLAAAHAEGLIHRDIKPGNILLETSINDHVKITDFGLARAADDASMTRSGVIAGTPMYMAPEQALGHKLDQRVDLFSLGSVLYQMISGRPPFRAPSTVAVLKRVAEDTPRPIQEIIPETPDWMCNLIARLHAKDPDDRFDSAQQVSELLGRCLDDLQNGRTPDVAPPNDVEHKVPRQGSERRQSRRDSGKSFAKVAAVAILLLVGVGVTESTGVTQLTKTVIRLMTGSGTLVIETNDEDVSITIDGEEVTIHGGGVSSITLSPGDHSVTASKGGKVQQELVTITRNGQTRLRMRLETDVEEVVDTDEVSANSQRGSSTRYALAFDGDADYVATDVFYDGSTPLTVEATVQISEWPVQKREFHSEIVGCTQLGGFGLGTSKTGFYLSARVGDGYVNVNSLAEESYLNRPIKLAGVIEGPWLRLFIDGKQVGQTSFEHTYNPGSQKISLGTSPGNGVPHDGRGYEWAGTMYEVRISNVARYRSEYDASGPLTADEHTLALYRFDEGSGDVIHDSSGNGHHGNIVGAKWVKVPPDGSSSPGSADQLPMTIDRSLEQLPLHARAANDLDLTSDGRYLVSVADGWDADEVTVSVYDTQQRKQVGQLKGISAAACECLGNHSVLISYYRNIRSPVDEVPYQFEIRTLPDLSVARQFGTEINEHREMSVTPDGKFICTIDHNHPGTFRIWDFKTGEVLQQFSVDASVQRRSLSISGDGKQAVFTKSGSTLQFVDLEELAETQTLETTINDLSLVRWASFDPNLLVSGGMDGSLTLHDLSTGENRQNFSGHTKGIYSATWVRANRYLLSGSADGSLRLWETDSGEELYRFEGKNLSTLYADVFEPSSLIYTGGGKWLHSSPTWRVFNENQLEVWRLPDSEELRRLSRQVHDSQRPVASADDAPPPAIAPFDAEQAKAHQEAWANYLGVPVEYENSIGMKFRLIPPGEFLMGSTPGEIEAALEAVGDDEARREQIESQTPQHKVILTRPVYFGITEVTQTQYEEVMGVNPSVVTRRTAAAGESTDNHPVASVRWIDTIEFCAKLSQQEQLQPFSIVSDETITPLGGIGYRLPTEAEWEFACRAGSTTRFWNGDQESDLRSSGWYEGNSGGRPRAVGTLEANPFELFDVHGNVREWVQDNWDPTYYRSISGKPAIDPCCSLSANFPRAIRGGYFVNPAFQCESSARYANLSKFRGANVGFRVVLPVDAVKQLQKAESNAKSPAKTESSPRSDFALSFDGEDDYVETPKLLDDPKSPLTLEAYLTHENDAKNGVVIGTHAGLGARNMAVGSNWQVFAHAIDPEGQMFRIEGSRGSDRGLRRTHVAVVWDENGTPRIFVDGYETQTNSQIQPRQGDAADKPFDGAFTIGTGPINFWTKGELPQLCYQGIIDEVRISKVARYTDNFTPLKRLETDAHTLALYHCDEGEGDVLKDSSGNEHHAKIHGAGWIKSDNRE